MVNNLVQIAQKSNETSDGAFSEERLVAFKMLCLFAKVKPQLLVKHVNALQPYLSSESAQVIMSITGILELTVPLVKDPRTSYLVQLEEQAIKLILWHNFAVLKVVCHC